ncbi:hypothetical protein M432DRAFT_593706 [Thermoascus aurantiacus ATCC 26904]
MFKSIDPDPICYNSHVAPMGPNACDDLNFLFQQEANIFVACRISNEKNFLFPIFTAECQPRIRSRTPCLSQHVRDFHFRTFFWHLLSFKRRLLTSMAKKANNGTDPILRKSIRKAILSRHQQNKPINREAIKAEYLSKNPDLANYINNIVNDCSDYLESKLKTANAAKSPTPAQASKDPSPISTSQHRSGINIISKLPESHSKTELSLTESSASSSQLGPVADHRTSSGSDEELSSFDVVNSAGSNGDGISDNVLLQEFKEHLAGNFEKGTSREALSAIPSLEIQKQFLVSVEDNDRMKGTIPTEQAVLVSPALDSCGSVELILLSKKGPPQKLHGVHPNGRMYVVFLSVTRKDWSPLRAGEETWSGTTRFLSETLCAFVDKTSHLMRRAWRHSEIQFAVSQPRGFELAVMANSASPGPYPRA